jgi:dolichol-phosphate mannosyltransferase
MSADPSTLLSVVVPCFNEAEVIGETHRRLTNVLSGLDRIDYEILYVDDGSTDGTTEALGGIQAGDGRVRTVRLSRNFGHQVALTAGVEHASGDGVVVIDADLQDPPEVIGQMVERWRAGAHVVYGERTGRAGETAFKLWTAKLFYRLINRLSDVSIPLDTGDFRLMDRRAVEALLAMPERDRFVRGMVSWAGFNQEAVPYERAARTSGETHYPFLKMVRLASDAIVSFSAVPLKMATWLGFLTSGLSMLGIFYALFLRLFTSIWVSGWTLMFIAVLFFGGVQLISLGIIGEYIGRIYAESKRRPLYFVQERGGFPAAENRSEDA